MPWYIFDRHVLEPLGDFVKMWSADLPLESDFSTSLFGSWYLTPKQHAAEFIIYNLAFMYLFVVFLKKALAPGTAIAKALEEAKKAAPTRRSKVDLALVAVLAASLALVWYHKGNSGTRIFLLQPCHVSMVTLIIMMLWSPMSSVPHVVFNVYLHTMWGTLLAIFSPDLRDNKQFLEVENFWFEHYALLITPLIITYNNRLVAFPASRDLALASFLFKALYHSFVLAPVSLRSGNNLNYLLMPPPGPLQWFGELYRLVMYLFCCLLTFATRYVLAEVVLRIMPRRKGVEKVKGE
ncbi:hypothetical protein AMAG_03072 [Allomyces macrogynus ATCC 38327]|uniref:Uncharacterized protein n=1 Tax=Allomyces macrogynus (strain ATCC 38327) TaxID=578462 RepID=A0A0L0S4A4_ALLM3|nr:hypothetical protein AMAG_03072 [Allomyces macrogynus ATCC 38327]|eukprot:KNE57352.1 hypothetical protein AMAG_03072 [Allomyces macrogynus ATCC 38327]